MRNFVKRILSIVISTCISLCSFAFTAIGPFSFQLIKTPHCDDPLEPEQILGRRIPPRPIQCTIDPESGLIIPSLDKSDIELYEIYSDDNICLISTEDEQEFIDTLLSLTGTIEINIHTADYSYIGDVII